jgi:hypothetical protein
MDRKLSELGYEELTRLPRISDRNWIGEETIYLHLRNSKKMEWYLAEYDHTRRKFFGFSDNRNEGVYWGLIEIDELLSYGRKGRDWEVLVDADWKPVKSKEIPALQGYIGLLISMPDGL